MLANVSARLRVSANVLLASNRFVIVSTRLAVSANALRNRLLMLDASELDKVSDNVLGRCFTAATVSDIARLNVLLRNL